MALNTEHELLKYISYSHKHNIHILINSALNIFAAFWISEIYYTTVKQPFTISTFEIHNTQNLLTMYSNVAFCNDETMKITTNGQRKKGEEEKK